MCQYTVKHEHRGLEYLVNVNGKTRVYCDEAIDQTVSKGKIVYVVSRVMNPKSYEERLKNE